MLVLSEYAIYNNSAMKNIQKYLNIPDNLLYNKLHKNKPKRAFSGSMFYALKKVSQRPYEVLCVHESGV
jgi:hypothetical protein